MVEKKQEQARPAPDHRRQPPENAKQPKGPEEEPKTDRERAEHQDRIQTGRTKL